MESSQLENASLNTKLDIMSFFNATVLFSSYNDWFCSSGFLPTNHFLFHLANAFLLLSCLAPVGIYGLLYLRASLLIACFIFTLWGLFILCALDTFIWNAVLTITNFIHICIIAYMHRPVKFTKELEVVYREFFQPLRVSRLDFKKVLQCMREVQTLKPREPYCVEKVTKVERLTLVLSGRLVVSQRGRVLHVIDNRQFLDSPEWFIICTGDHYEVSITAIEECRLLIWHRDKLKLSISNNEFLQAVFENILSKDVMKKLLHITELCNGINLHIYDGDATSETAYLLSRGKENQTGLSVLLNRQISNRDFNIWNAAKLAERDCETETAV